MSPISSAHAAPLAAHEPASLDPYTESRRSPRMQPSTPPPAGGARWWFAFDRWFAVDEQEPEFVLG